MLVKNQDDSRFKQLQIQQTVWNGEEEMILMVSNQNILKPFDNAYEDKVYRT